MANQFTDAVFHAKVPAVDKAVLWAIAHRTDNETGACYPSIKTIAKEAGCSVTITKEVIAYTVNVGLLSIQNRKEGKRALANEYTISLKKLRWITRADERFLPNGETDQGTRASTASSSLPAQGASRPGGGSGGGSGVGCLPAGGWVWRRLQNSEVDLRSRSRQSNSDSTAETARQKTRDTDQNQNPYPSGQPELQAMMAASRQLLHDKSCPCYPRRADILCLCGLYEILLNDLAGCYDCACMDPHPDTTGDSPEMYGVSCTKCKGFVQWPTDDDKLGTWISRTVPDPTDFGGVEAKAAAAPEGGPVNYCGLCYKRPCADGEDVCSKCLNE